MTEVWLRAGLWLWLGLALAATLISIRLRIATALSEMVANAFFVPRYLLPKAEAPPLAGTVPHAMAVGEREG